MRPVDWRWQLACDLRNNDSAALADQDIWVRTAAALQSAMDPGRSRAEADRLIAGLDPAAADAYGFWQLADQAAHQPTVTDPEYVRTYGPLTPRAIAQAELEALILADRKPATIAARTGLSVAAVNTYEALWFDVRDRLRCASWVLANVIGSLHQGSIGALLPALIRAYGYHTRSARIVAMVAGGFDPKLTRTAARSPETFFAQDALFAGALKANLAIRLMPLEDRRTYARMVELHQEATRIAAEGAVAAGDDDEHKLRAAVKTIGEQIKFRYGKAPPEDVSQVRLLKLTQTPNEEVG